MSEILFRNFQLLVCCGLLHQLSVTEISDAFCHSVGAIFCHYGLQMVAERGAGPVDVGWRHLIPILGYGPTQGGPNSMGPRLDLPLQNAPIRKVQQVED